MAGVARKIFEGKRELPATPKHLRLEKKKKKSHRVRGLQKGRKLDFVYTNGRVSGIRVDGVEKLSVEYDSVTGEAKALVVNSKRIEIELDQQPRVQNINGQNVVGGMERSLKKLTLADGTVKTYEFGVDDKLQPTLKVGNRLFTCDPKTRTILKDNEWIYDIKQFSPLERLEVLKKIECAVQEDAVIRLQNNTGQIDAFFSQIIWKTLNCLGSNLENGKGHYESYQFLT